MIARLLSDYGMLLALLLLGALLSVWTLGEQHPSGAGAAEQIAGAIAAQTRPGDAIAILGRDSADDRAFAAALADRLTDRTVVARVNGQPSDAVKAMQDLERRGIRLEAIAVTKEAGDWAIFENFDQRFPRLAGAQIVMPTSYYWPVFLNAANLVNIANQITVIAILAIGMTMVIIAGGIDLSVGSLLALAAVLSTLLIRELAGAREASGVGMVLCCGAAIGLSAAVGFFTGVIVTAFRVPAFIITLGVMLMASGAAGKLTQGQTVFELPDSFVWLGRESTLGVLPNSVILMLLLYVIAHLVMAHTVLGRYIYAVGGNLEAARLSGVPVRRVLIAVYVVSAALAGLGGVIIASQLKSGSPNYGLKYELYVIAAVVVGGTSLAGGEGKILGTLIGALFIAVIQNGMNLVGLQSFDQDVVLGGVIVAAVLLDRVKHLRWRWRRGG